MDKTSGSNKSEKKDKNKIYGKKGEYAVMSKIGEGTFSEVLKVQNSRDGSLWACKRMKQRFDKVEDIQRIREIQAIRRLRKHPNVIQLAEIIYDKGSRTLYLVCELMDMNVYELIKDRTHYLNEHKVKHYMYQLLQAIYHMHKNGIFHRDIKPENILIRGDLLKVADFGSCRSISSKQPLTEYISTRWYRAPECLLTDGYYTYKMDVWSAGCVYYEILTLRPLFPGSNELDQIAKIHDVMGTPDPTVISKLQGKIQNLDFNFPKVSGKGILRHLSHVTKDTVDLIERMCEYDPESRLTTKQALEHNHFDDYRRKLLAERRASEAEKKKTDGGGTAGGRTGGSTAGNSPTRRETTDAAAAAKATAEARRQKRQKRRAPTIGALAKAASGDSSTASTNGGPGYLILPKMMSQHSLSEHHQTLPGHHKGGGLGVFHHPTSNPAKPAVTSTTAAAAAAAKGIITLPDISRTTHHHHHLKNNLATSSTTSAAATDKGHEVQQYELPSINRQ